MRKVRTVFSGLRYAVIYDWSVTCKLIFSVGVLLVAFFLRAWVGFLLILRVTALLVIAEILNSVVEALCDFVETRYDERIIKDMAAAAVGISIFVWLIALAVEINRFLWQF